MLCNHVQLLTWRGWTERVSEVEARMGNEGICYLPTWPVLMDRIAPLFLGLMLTRDTTGR